MVKRTVVCSDIENGGLSMIDVWQMQLSSLLHFSVRLYDHIQTSDRFASYKTFKTSYIREPYLLIKCNRFIKCALTKFRCGVSDIKVHRHRYKNLNIVDMNCLLYTSPSPRDDY